MDSSWNPNQRGLVDHGNRHHYKTIEKQNPRENKRRIEILFLEAPDA